MNYSSLTLLYFSLVASFSGIAIYSKYRKPNLFLFAKPLPIVIILFFLVYSMISHFPAISQGKYPLSFTLMLLGLLAGLAGDLFLLKENLFKKGIYAFLAGQVFYLIAFSGAPWQAPIWLIVLIFLYGIIFGSFINYQLNVRSENDFIIPVWLYITAILSMFTFSINWQISYSNSGLPLIPLGAFLFCISDTLIGFNRFVKPFPFARLFILSFYYTAQSLLIFGAIRLLWNS